MKLHLDLQFDRVFLSKESLKIMKIIMVNTDTYKYEHIVHPLHIESSNKMTGNWQTNLKIYQPVVEEST